LVEGRLVEGPHGDEAVADKEVDELVDEGELVRMKKRPPL
jgi:hypothetical protein